MDSDLRPATLLPGKLPAERLRAILTALPQRDPRVVVGPRLGEDAAVLDMGDRCLVITTDPVTMAAECIGWYAVHVNANDVAVMGARPRWFFPVILLPEGVAADALVGQIMAEIVAACEGLDVTVCGGHTEVTVGLDRPIVVGQMLGEVERHALVRKSNLQIGDRILITRGVAIEGTAILARELSEKLAGRVPDELLARARIMLTDPGISVVEAALAAVEAGGVRAMHDPTEGGVLTGLSELAAASGQGLRVHGDRIPVYEETRAICGVLGIDPLGLIASGALLIGTPPAASNGIVGALTRRGIAVTDVGEVVPLAEAVTIEADGVRLPLVPPDRDELARILS
jgi:hydrogenase maturation factor